ncbi:MAG: export ABC transporter ATP-binding protein [Actinomycetales bacterium]|nr:MAG: export ABC transporter ATP-binding protein [Actinomycetales bacterium]
MTIDVCNVTHTYGGRRALFDVSFTVPSGSVAGLIGPNGSGKSTLLRRALGLDDGPGHVTFNGVRYLDLTIPTRSVGAVLDTGGMWPGARVKDHLGAAAAATGTSRRRVAEVLETVGLSEASNLRVKALSLGMRQRLALATALLPRPTHLVLDEPTNGLDPHAVQWLGRSLRAHAFDGGCVLISSHLISEIEVIADDVLMISQGKLLMQGPPQQIAAQATRTTLLILCSSPLRLARYLTDLGARATPDLGDRLRVDGISEPAVRDVARTGDVEIAEVIPVPASLEAAYLEIVQS